MSKLLTEPKNGYVKPKDDASSGIYPKTLVEAVYWDKKKMTLEETLENVVSASVETEIPVDGMKPNTVYNFGTITENTTFVMAEGEEGKVNHYFWVFETGDEVPEITWPEGIRMWEDNKTPVIAANQHYEISVYDGVGLYEVIGIDSTSRYLGIPLTIEAITDGIIPLYKIGEYPDPFIFKYKKNNEDWNVWDETNNNYNKVDVIAGDKVSFVANYNYVPYYDDPLEGFFANSDEEQSCSYKVYGNVVSLVGGDDFVSLTELPSGECFHGLFGCEFSDRVSGLVDASNLILPNITLTNSCYSLMFAKCINLERGPQILAKKLESCSCQSMFFRCSKLNYIKCLSTDISTNYCTSWWIEDVAESGTFVKAKGMNDWTVGHDGIPEGWMVVEEGGDEPDLEPSGDSPFVVFRSEINLLSLGPSSKLTKAEFAEYLHTTEKDVDDLYAGKYNVVICPDNIPMFLVEYHSLSGTNRVKFVPSSYNGDGFIIYNFGDEWANNYAWD